MTLKQRIEEKIAACAPGFEQLPAIVIVYNLVEDRVAWVSPRGLEALGVTMEELSDMGGNYFPRFYNQEQAKDYIPKIFGLLQRNSPGDTITFFQQIRTVHRTDWQLFLSSVTIFLRDDNGLPLLNVTVATPIDTHSNISSKVERLLDENNFFRENKDLFAAMTSREKEIMKLIAMGKNSAEMAEYFSCSEHTINTHRRNIKKKLNAENYFDIVRFVQAFDMV